jgi:hypothetical protein
MVSRVLPRPLYMRFSKSLTTQKSKKGTPAFSLHSDRTCRRDVLSILWLPKPVVLPEAVYFKNTVLTTPGPRQRGYGEELFKSYLRVLGRLSYDLQVPVRDYNVANFKFLRLANKFGYRVLSPDEWLKPLGPNRVSKPREAGAASFFVGREFVPLPHSLTPAEEQALKWMKREIQKFQLVRSGK